MSAASSLPVLLRASSVLSKKGGGIVRLREALCVAPEFGNLKPQVDSQDPTMADKFRKGEIVVLKSGGPPMTVDEVPSDPDYKGEPKGSYGTRWFKGASQESGHFKEHLLDKYVPPAKK